MGQTKKKLSDNVISASEIGQYHYCSIAWYLQRCGYEPLSDRLDAGVKIHTTLGDAIDYTKLNTRKSKILAYLGYILLVIGALLVIFEVIL